MKLKKTFDVSWEQVHQTTDWGEYPPEELVRFIMRRYKKAPKIKRKNIRVLEIGCGQGANAFFFNREGFDYTGIDGSATAIKKAKKRFSNLADKFYKMDAVSLNFEDNCFDIVVDIACIYSNTVEGINCILDEVYRVLKFNGIIFSTGLFTTNTTGFGTGKKIEKNTYFDVKEGVGAGKRGKVHYFTLNEVKKFFGSKFKINEINLLKRTDNNMKKIIEYYIVSGIKDE